MDISISLNLDKKQLSFLRKIRTSMLRNAARREQISTDEAAELLSANLGTDITTLEAFCKAILQKGGMVGLQQLMEAPSIAQGMLARSLLKSG